MSDTVERIAKLLLQAEGKGLTDAEREAFQKMAQKIATQSSIDLDIARAHNIAGKRIPKLTTKKIVLGQRRQSGLHTYCNLIMGIGRANNLKFNIAHNSTYVIAFGYDTDIEVTEALFASILTQMVEASNAYLATGEFKNETTWREGRYRKPTQDEIDSGYYRWEKVWEDGKYVPVHGKTARISFQSAFAARVEHRMIMARYEAEEAAKEAQRTNVHADGEDPEIAAATTSSDSVSLVLKRKSEAVDEFYSAKSNARGSWKGGRNNATSYRAHNAGDNAGAKARLTAAKAIGGHRTQVSA